MTEDDLRQWIEADHLLGELEKTDGYRTLTDLVQGKVAELQRRLLNGNVVSMEDYKLTAGRLAGINDVMTMRDQVVRIIATERQRLAEAE